MHMMRIALATACIALLVLAHTASAFPTGEQFDGDALTTDGGGGIPFDGAPRWAGHACDVCHTDAPGSIGIRLEADQTSLFTSGWKASTQYHLRVVLENEHEGLAYASLGNNCGFAVTPYVPCDNNGFAIEFDTDVGTPTGTLDPVVGSDCAAGSAMIPTDVDTYVLADGTAATHNGAIAAQTHWDLCWTSPAAGAGAITAYVAVVDGNGGDGTMNFPSNATGDDVAVGAVPLAELGVTTTTQTGGCAAAGDAGVATALVVLLLAAISRGRRRRLAIALALATAGGCVHVRPRERETLARRNMKFSPDTAEDELDLHMQEAREGSEGGYGTSGGGCGCN